MAYLWNKYDRSRTADRLLWLAAACLCAWTVASTFAQSQEAAARFPVTSSQILSAMLGRQLPTEDARIEIAAPITATTANAQLEIQSVALVNSHEIRLRLSCRNHAECLSFFAFAMYPEDVNAHQLSTKLEQPSKDAKFDTQGQHLNTPGSAVNNSESIHPGVKSDPTLRAGAPVMLQIDGDRIHILVEVICLESGSTGDRIRVTTRDHKQSYVAQIVTPTLLKGTL